MKKLLTMGLAVFLFSARFVGAEDTHAFPNPFVARNSTTGTIAFTPLPPGGNIVISTIDGHEVRTIHINAGDAIISWDTKNNNGQNVVTGVYYFHVDGGGGIAETLGKIVIIR